jgi:hypothetical protein
MTGAVEAMNSTPARTMTPKKTLFTVSRSWSPTSAANTPRDACDEKSSLARGTATSVRCSSGTSSVERAARPPRGENENRR